MKMISKTDLLDKLKAYIKTPDTDTIRYKKKIEKMKDRKRKNCIM